MDGFTVGASFIGLFGAAAKITLGLHDFITWVKEAPKMASAVLREVQDVLACLKQVQTLLLGAGRVNTSNQSLMTVEAVDVVLSNCVFTLEELNKLVEGLKLDQQTSISFLRRWATREKAIAALLLRLQSSKNSLSLMISVMTHRSIEDARQSMNRLTDEVRQLRERDQDILKRLDRMEMKNPDCVSTTVRTTCDSVGEEFIEDYESIVTVRQLNAGPSEGKAGGQKVSRSQPEFESLLKASRPYIRASRRRGPSLSTTSSVVRTLGWSCLSGISLAEVSNISIMELSLDKNRVWNSTRYDAGPRYLGIVAKGKILKTRSLDALPFHIKMGFDCCKECGENFHQQEIACHSSDDNWWHRKCVRCTFCSALWEGIPRNFYKLKTLTCSNCLPDCRICGFKSDMYPVFEREEAICSNCMSDGSPCNICGLIIWNRGFLGFFEGIACFHYRNFLVQRAPHMVMFFDSDDRSLSGITSEGTPAIAEIDEPQLPLRTEQSLRQIDSQSNIFHQETQDRGEGDVKDDEPSKFADTATGSSSHKTRAERKRTAKSLLGRPEKQGESGQLARRVRPRVSAPLDIGNSLGFY